jgi:hypothetical protein
MWLNPSERMSAQLDRAPRRAARAGVPAGIAAQGFTDRLRIGAALNGNREHNRSVTRIRVCRAVALVVIQEQLADRAVREAPNGAGVAKTADPELKGFGQAAIRQAGARAHCGPRSRCSQPSLGEPA